MKTKKLIVSFLATVALVAVLAACKSESHLKSQAKISEDQARQIAISKVPNGTIKESELEKEKGRLIWSFDIAIPDSKDIKEVNVDAITGEVVAVETETPRQQAKEKDDEKEGK
ncbi:MAG TPA: PepSY domain-containing protein [Verrucomicrobiae bacterium]|nr:PepSY domain-containing protein [Verrucomicrobiae bacterium]